MLRVSRSHYFAKAMPRTALSSSSLSSIVKIVRPEASFLNPEMTQTEKRTRRPGRSDSYKKFPKWWHSGGSLAEVSQALWD
jgi:hypothetical protein